MAPNDSEIVLKFETVEDELSYWKNEAEFYKRKYHLLKSSKRLKESDDEEEDKINKKPRVIQLFKDPMQMLPQYCKEKILKYFTGQELLKLTEVSKTWRNEIESTPVLMNRIVDNVKLSVEDEFLKEDLAILKKNNRKYKHLKLNDCFEEDVKECLIRRFSQTLESLTIKDNANFHRKDQIPCKFPKLRKLSLSHYDDSWLDWLTQCDFPLLNELRCDHKNSMEFLNYQMHNDEYGTWIDNLVEIFEGSCDIKHLYLRTEEEESIDSMETENELLSFDCGYILPKSFIALHSYTLTTLSAGCSLSDLCFILEECENLVTLAINVDSEDEEEESDEECMIVSGMDEDEDGIMQDVPTNRSIENLKICTDDLKVFFKILCALPSLKKLVTYNFLTRNSITCIARFSHKLQKLICRGGFQKYFLDEYESIQRHEVYNPRVNTNIEILLEERRDWNGNECIWDEKF